MKKQLLISAFCVCASLSAMAGEQGVERTDGLVGTQTSQPQGQINSSADEMNASNDETSGQQTFNKLPKDWHLLSELEKVTSLIDTYSIRWNEYAPRPDNVVPRPIRPPKPGDEPNPGESIESTIRDILTNGGRNHSFVTTHHGFDDPVTLGSGGKVPKPIKPRTSNPSDQLTLMTYGGGSPLTFVSTGHGSKPAGDVNSDGVLNLDDVTTMVDNLLSNQNHGAGNGIGDVTGMIDQLLGE